MVKKNNNKSVSGIWDVKVGIDHSQLIIKLTYASEIK